MKNFLEVVEEIKSIISLKNVQILNLDELSKLDFKIFQRQLENS